MHQTHVLPLCIPQVLPLCIYNCLQYCFSLHFFYHLHWKGYCYQGSSDPSRSSIHVTEIDCSELHSLLNTLSTLFSQGLGRIKGTSACLYLKERSRDFSVPSETKSPKRSTNKWKQVFQNQSSSRQATPVVPILNKDGLSSSGDYMVTVNRKTVTETYPLP